MLDRVRWWAVGAMAVSAYAAPPQNQDTSELLRRLASRLDVAPIGQGDAARALDAREAARSLVARGPAVGPELDAALDSIESQGSKSAFAANVDWLLDVYALTLGPSALPRLRRLAESPELNPPGLSTFGIDNAIALALRLTFYVSAKREPMQYFPGHEPREDLDQFLLAWMRNDRIWLAAKLGPAGKTSMSSLLAGSDWTGMRAKLWPAGSEPLAVGFRFAVEGRWSKPADTLDDDLLEQSRAGAGLENLGQRFMFATTFTDSSGAICGTHKITFVEAPQQYEYGHYLLDNSDLPELLAIISSCAVR